MKKIFYIAFVFIFCAFGLPKCDPIVKILEKYGYILLTPPNRVISPGTILYFNQSDPYDRGIACYPEETLGTDYQSLMRADTTMQIVQEIESEGEISFSADFYEQIKGNVKFKDISEIKVRFMNPRVVFVSTASVIERMSQRTNSCRKAIEVLLHKKTSSGREAYTVYLVNSALQADVQYHINFTSDVEVTAKAKIEMLDNLNTEFKIGQVNTKVESIDGENLFWGVVMNDNGIQTILNSQLADPSSVAAPITPSNGSEFSQLPEGSYAPPITTFLKDGMLDLHSLKKRKRTVKTR